MNATKLLRRALSLLLVLATVLSMGAGAFAAEVKPETKAALVSGTDYVMMDFFSSGKERNYGWYARTNNAAAQSVTWNDADYASMDVALSGTDSYIYMPNDATNRINYTMKQGDRVTVRLNMSQSGQSFTDSAVASQLFYIAGGMNTNYAEAQCVSISTLKFKAGDQTITFNLPDSCAGKVLYNLRLDLFGEALAANVKIDYIHVGPANSIPPRYDSTKTLYTGTNQSDDLFSIQLDAFQHGIMDVTKSGVPLDVSIVFDRSQSMSQPASTNASDYKQFNAYYPNTTNNSYNRNDITYTTNINNTIASLEAYLDTLKTDKYDGYYRATNMLKRYSPYFINNHVGFAGEGIASWEPMRYRNGEWQMRITTGNWTADYPGGIDTVNRDSTSIANYKVQWVSVVEGYKEWLVRTERIREQAPSTAVGLSGYCKFVIATPRLTKAIDATETFIRNIYNSGTSLPAGQKHTISILSFGGGVFATGEKYYYNKYNASTDKNEKITGTLADELGVSRTVTTLDSTTNLNNVIKTLRGHYTYTNTKTDWALETVKNNRNYLPAAATGRKRIVLLITDGAPTSGDNMELAVANAALTNAKSLKSGGVELYTIGFMAGLDDSAAPGSFNSNNPGAATNANSFLKACSSMYPSASAMGSAGTENSNKIPYYLADDGTGSKLKNIFQTMQSYIIESSYGPYFDVNYLSLYDEITREFLLDTTKPIKVYADPYAGNYAYGTRATLGTHTFTQPTDSTPVKIAGTGYSIILTKAGELTKVKLDWSDSKYAFLREQDYDAGGAYSTTYKKGYKIVLELPLIVNRNNTLGGNNIPTNKNTSGFYQPTSDAAGASGTNLGTNIIKYPVPNANVKPNVDPVVYDYFMDLTDYINQYQNATPGSAAAQAVYEAMYQALSELQKYLENDKNDYVYIDIDLLDEARQLLDGWHAASTDSSFTADDPASNATFDFLKDQVLNFLVTLDPNTYENDSCADANNGDGVTPYKPVTEELHPNYYGPKYVVVDFDETVKTPLDKEGGLSPVLQSGVTNGKIEGTNICYNFRANYASGAKSYLEKNYTTVKYQVTAINAPKSQPSNKTVARNFYVIPANVMTYDDTFLTYDNNGWETVGTFSDNVQSHDNSVVHGFDSLYNGDYSKDYYHNAVKAVTVSNTKGIAQSTFSFTGTGFDIFAQTSPNSGTMTVELFTDSGFKNNAKTILVDTYLKDATLNQIPVVRLDDLDYRTWYVRITAFYDKGFDHNLGKSLRGGEPTEAKLRELLGLSADADFTFIPSASGYDHEDTRAIANAKNGQYNIYIDGFRVYNTLGTSLANNVIANYAYQQAGEGVANILNINDALVDASNPGAWGGSGANGVLYAAAGDSTSNQTDKTDGIILGMNGALYTKASGSKFYVYTDAACTQNVKYNGKNVYYRVQEIISPNGRTYQGLNYFYDGGSAAVPMTTHQIKAAFGSMPTYYNAKYSQYGPEKEVYLNGTNGVAFKVGTGAKKVMISLKSNNGQAATLSIYDPATSKFVNLATTTSRVEMYYDITKYMNGQGFIYLKNVSGITAVCNIKTNGATARAITIDRELLNWVQDIDGNALPVDGSAEIKHSLDLASDISLNYAVSTAKLADYDQSFMEVNFNGRTLFIEPEIRGDYGYFTVSGITAVDLTEKLTAKLHLFFGEEEYISETDVYCVADYAYAQLNKADAPAGLKEVCANLLRYGAQAQAFKGSENVAADEAMTAEHKTYLTDLNAVAAQNAAQAMGDVENGIAWAGKALVLDSKVAVKAVFDLKGFAGDKEALELRVSYTNYAGEQCDLVIEDYEIYNEEAQQYAFVIDSLLAADMRSILTMALYEADTQVSETQLYSVESYCANKTDTLGELCKALLAYSDAAKAFFAN